MALDYGRSVTQPEPKLLTFFVSLCLQIHFGCTVSPDLTPCELVEGTLTFAGMVKKVDKAKGGPKL